MYEELHHARNAVDVPTGRATQLAMELSEMDGALGELNKALEELSMRLQPLLRESEPAKGIEKAVSVPSVPFVAHLRQKRFVVSNFIYRVSDLLERLEL